MGNPDDSGQQEMERQNTSQLLRLPYQAFIEQLFARLAAEGFTDIHPAHAIVFQLIGASGTRVTELAERSQLTKQYLGRLVADLEDRGYLERVPDPTDGRAKLVRLSARGMEVTQAAETIIAEIEADWTQRIGADRHADLRHILIDLIGSLRSDVARNG